MGLSHKDQVQLPALIGGNPLNQGGSGPHYQRLYNGHVNQHSLQARKVEHYTEGLIPYGAVAVGCTTIVTPFFLYAGTASGSHSTSSPKVWNPLTPYLSRGSRSTNESPR
jgi:hypothetical protein